MFFGKSKKSCHICGVKVDKEKAEIVSGKYFCSKEHAEEHKKGAKQQKRGGCCH